uniref:Sialate O-acetylesterase domain-containing protein n=1 Tax=Astyanax mexicanus TaxID=7994 RepID=A0A8B9JLJ8_ASTMX
MLKHVIKLFRVCIFFSCFPGDAFRFASYYGDHMVLQKAPAGAVLWGYGSSGAQVKFLLSGPHSIWRVTLEPVPAGGPYNLTAIQKGTSSSKILLTDLLFGDVWLCGGQSNMAFTLAQVIMHCRYYFVFVLPIGTFGMQCGQCAKSCWKMKSTCSYINN